jgi:spore germination protein GerM
MNRSRRSATAVVFAALAALLVASGCGIPRDGEPREVAVDTDLLGPTSSASVPTGNATVFVYFPIEGEELVRVERDAENESDPELPLRHLLIGPRPEEREDKLSTSIPSGTELINTERDGDKLIINLTKGIDSIQGKNLITAFAQLVFTATSVKGEQVTRVQFRVEGEDRLALTDEGSLEIVVANNFKGANRPR